MMNIVLAGFSTQSTDVMRFFVEQHSPNIKCLCFERCFDENNLLLALPNIDNSQVDGFIINLNGVGITSAFSEKQRQTLIAFMNNKPTILLSSSSMIHLQQASMLPDTTFFQKIPYNKQQMQDKLSQLIVAIKSAPKLSVAQDNQIVGLPPPDVVPNTNITQNTPLLQTFKNSANTQKQILKTYFEKIYQNHTVLEIINALASAEPFKITIKNETVIINHHANCAIEGNAQHLLSGIYRAQSVDEIIEIEPLNNKELQDLQFFAQQKTYRRHALNTVLWQIYSAVLPEQLVAPDHNLLLKVRMMPYFGNMIDIPDYIHAVMAACLVSPKTLGQLQAMFPEFHDQKYKLQRVMVLAILSGLADMTVIESSLNEQTTTQNTAVVKAKKTGFFQRLLSKLSVV